METIEPLAFERIPIERHWGLSILLHKALGHTEPWEICDAGCDRLASDAIRELFDVPPVPSAGASDQLTPRGLSGA